MPLTPTRQQITQVADLIEKSDFSEGWSPDGLESATRDTVLPDVLNLVLDLNSASVETRDGFKRIREEFTGGALTADHYVKQIYSYITTDFTQYLVCVLTDESADPDNVQLWRIKMSDMTIARIDTPGVTYDVPTGVWWFLSIEGVLYGGSRRNPFFSWDGTTYTADAGTNGSPKTVVDDEGASVNTATEFGRDNAWKGHEIATYSGKKYRPLKDIRYDRWEDGQQYVVGDRVSRKNDGYWTSWRCIVKHVGDVSTNSPYDGSGYATYWKKIRLPLPTNEDGETSEAWSLMPPVAQTRVAAWFANRLFLRYDGQGDLTRVQYSAPLKPEKGEDIPDLVFDPTDFAPGNDNDGTGGGWLPFSDAGYGRGITTMIPFGTQLLVFTRFSVSVLSGTDDQTWDIKYLSHQFGAIGYKGAVVHDGLCYFLSYEGLCVTDGTSVQRVPGNEKVQVYLRDRLEGLYPFSTTGSGDGSPPSILSYKGFIVMALPWTADTDPFVTVFYDPMSQSFWKTNLPIYDMTVYRRAGAEHLAFVSKPNYSDVPLVYLYADPDAGATDDTGLASYASVGIDWHLLTAWLPFGTVREQRRIRRVWWVVKGAITYTIKQYRDWLDSESVSVSRAVSDDTTQHIEGLTMPDSHAMQMKLSGTTIEDPVSIYGFALDTQRRRKRYHTGRGNIS